MPDGTETQAGDKTSLASKGTSMVTEEQAKERERKARSDVLADASRARVEAERAVRTANEALNRLSKMEQERLDAELEAHRDEPDYIRGVRAEQEVRRVKSDLAQREQELKDEREVRTRLETERTELSKAETARDIAQSLNVDATKLVKLAKFTDGSREAIEDIANDLPKVGAPGGGGKPDSNQTRGGGSGKTPTLEELTASTPFETEQKIKSGEWIVRGWTK